MNIIDIYPNESVYSYLSRLFVHSGYISHMGVCREILKRPSEYPNYNYINCLNDEFKNRLIKYISYSELLINHTLFKYYVRFLDKDKKKKAFEVALNDSADLYKFITPTYNDESNYLRYCPICVKEDRANYGECYFHVEHLIPEISICYKHNCRLVNTKIINKKKDSIFVPLELIVEDYEDIKIYDSEDINVRVAKYVVNMFYKDINFEDEYLIKDYLVSCLKDKYFFKRGQRKNISLIYEDIEKYYKDLEVFNLSRNRVERIFRNISWNPYDILLILMFEDVDDLDKCEIKEDRSVVFDREVRRLYELGYSYNKIGKELEVNKETIRKVILNKYK